MRLQLDGGGIHGTSGQKRGGTHGPDQTQSGRTMGTTHVSQSGQVLHWILQLLLKIYPPFLRYRAATHRPNQEGSTFRLGKGAR